jgi:hypothetical protein
MMSLTRAFCSHRRGCSLRRVLSLAAARDVVHQVANAFDHYPAVVLTAMQRSAAAVRPRRERYPAR